MGVRDWNEELVAKSDARAEDTIEEKQKRAKRY